MVLHQKLQGRNNIALITRNGMVTLVHVDQIRNVQLEVCGNNNSNIESSDDANNDSNTSSHLRNTNVDIKVRQDYLSNMW